MRLSCCAYSYRDALQGGRMTLQEFVRTCRMIGFDGVELTAYYFPSTERDFLNAMKQLAHGEGVTISGTAVGSDFAQPEEDRLRDHVRMVKEWVEHSVVLGAPTLRVFAGPVRPGNDPEATFVLAVECLQECADYAWERGVVLALENHGGLTSTAEGALRLLNAVGSPGMKLNLDFGNFSGDIYAQFAACAPFAVATHAKRFAVIEPGRAESRTPVDYARVRTVMEAAEYRGFLAIEYEDPEPAEEAVPAFAAQLQAVLA